MILSKCAVCDSKLRYIKEQETYMLLSNLGLIATLSDLF